MPPSSASGCSIVPPGVRCGPLVGPPQLSGLRWPTCQRTPRGLAGRVLLHTDQAPRSLGTGRLFMDQDEPRSLSGGHKPERNPRPVTINPDALACETSSPGTRSVTPHSGSGRPGTARPHPLRSPASRPMPDRAGGEMRRPRVAFIDRIVEVRRDLFGDEGIPAIADALHLPHRTWMNYEKGVVMPAPVLLCFLDLTSVEPHWLLTGRGPKYQGAEPGRGSDSSTEPRTGDDRTPRRSTGSEIVPQNDGSPRRRP